jgi:hypothetical protein
MSAKKTCSVAPFANRCRVKWVPINPVPPNKTHTRKVLVFISRISLSDASLKSYPSLAITRQTWKEEITLAYSGFHLNVSCLGRGEARLRLQRHKKRRAITRIAPTRDSRNLSEA